MSAVAAGLDSARSRSEDADAPRAGHRSVVAVRRHLGAPSPWARRDAAVAGVLALIGAVVVGIGWNGASQEQAFRDQIGWVVAAVGGVGVFALGGGFWVLVGFRRTRQCLAQLQFDFEVVCGSVGAVPDPTPEPRGPGEGALLVSAPGMRLAHRGDCLLVRGKAVHAVGAGEAEAYPRCAMCCS